MHLKTLLRNRTAQLFGFRGMLNKEQPHVNGIRFANLLNMGVPIVLTHHKTGIEEMLKKGNLWTQQQSATPGASQEKLKGKHCKAAFFKLIS